MKVGVNDLLFDADHLDCGCKAYAGKLYVRSKIRVFCNEKSSYADVITHHCDSDDCYARALVNLLPADCFLSETKVIRAGEKQNEVNGYVNYR